MSAYSPPPLWVLQALRFLITVGLGAAVWWVLHRLYVLGAL